MNNREIQAAWKYHNGSKHSPWSVRINPHFLDLANQPLPFKIYPKIELLPLLRDVPQTGVAASSAISEQVPSSRANSVPSRQDSCRDVGIDQFVQVMEQKPALIWLDSGLGFQPALDQGQGTRPGEQFREESPNKRSDVQPAKQWARTCQNGAEDDPQNEERVQREHANR